MNFASVPPPFPRPIALNANQLNVSKESSYFIVVLVFSILVWLGIVLSLIGIFYGAMIALLIWLGNGLLVAHLRSEAVRVSERQLPALNTTFEGVWAKLGGTGPIPALYVIQAGGALNAFATRFSGRNFVVVYSDLLEAFGPSSSEMQFILGHEIGHIKSNHLPKQLLIAPGLMLPLVGTAYLRACETSSDLHGAYAADDINGAIRAMTTLGGGRHPAINPDAFAQQHGDERGFFISWHEITSSYPTLSARTANLINLANPGSAPSAPPRHPLAYLFAFMTPGGRFAGGANILVFIVIIGLLAAMAIPAFQKVRMAAQTKTCEINQHLIAAAYADAYRTNGKDPEAYADFIGDGKILAVMPECPEHGEYEVTANDDHTATVSCSVHNHTPSIR